MVRVSGVDRSLVRAVKKTGNKICEVDIGVETVICVGELRALEKQLDGKGLMRLVQTSCLRSQVIELLSPL